MIESTTEESANESDIFGSTSDTVHTSSSSSSSDFENEMKRKRAKRIPKRRLSSKSITIDEIHPIDEPQENILPVSPDELNEEEIKKEVKKEVRYSKRPLGAERVLLEQFIYSGLDKEDLLMIRLAFLRLRDDNSDIINGVQWAYYPPNILSPIIIILLLLLFLFIVATLL